jgi:hypothetical protein
VLKLKIILETKIILERKIQIRVKLQEEKEDKIKIIKNCA